MEELTIYVGAADILAVLLGTFLRLLYSLNKKYKLTQEEPKLGSFSLAKYFDKPHAVRWCTHIVFAIMLLPPFSYFFSKWLSPSYFGEYGNWDAGLSTLVGFFGYSLISFAQKFGQHIGKKKGLNPYSDG